MSPVIKTGSKGGQRSGFTLVELLVAIAILSILFLVMANLIALTSKTYLQTTVKAGQFRSAQAGFESLTRRLSQATLNTYLDYEDASNNTDQAYVTGSTTAFVPNHYGRQSELRFIAGNIPAAGQSSGYDPNLGPAASPPRPSQAIFFAAPLSVSAQSSNTGLNRLLNICGYYIEYNQDPTIPTALAGLPQRYRFRLMEMVQPTENVSLYADEVAAGANAYTRHGWFSGPLMATPTTSGTDTDSNTTEPYCSYVLAENVVALIVLPKLSPEDEQAHYGSNTGAVLSPNYFYDSTSIGQAGSYSTAPDGTGFSPAGGANSKNQLPPVVQVTMVAIDEPSAIRLQAKYGNAASSAIYGPATSLFQMATNYTADLTSLENQLSALQLTYHVFQTNVSIKEAKWSSLQTKP